MQLDILMSPSSTLLSLLTTFILSQLCLCSSDIRQTEHIFVWKNRCITSVRMPINVVICVQTYLNIHLELYDEADVGTTVWNLISNRHRNSCLQTLQNKENKNKYIIPFCFKDFQILLNVFLNDIQTLANKYINEILPLRVPTSCCWHLCSAGILCLTQDFWYMPLACALQNDKFS